MRAGIDKVIVKTSAGRQERGHKSTDLASAIRGLALLVIACCAAPSALHATDGAKIAAAAEAQIGKTIRYDPAYVRLDYPGGDLELERGVCTDVVIRALRAVEIDLQQRVHEDMHDAFSAYPDLWGLRKPDRNIDHRRVPNLETWMRRQDWTLDPQSAQWQAGDLVSWRLPDGRPHIGVLSAQVNAAGTPLVVHNIGVGAKLEDVLHAWPIVGAFRVGGNR